MRAESVEAKSSGISSKYTSRPHRKSMPPFIPAFALPEPEPLTQPSGRSACSRLARIDLPEPAPPHSSKKYETSWNGSNAWQCMSSISLTSPPAMRRPLEKSDMRKARWWPNGVKSVATSDCPCAKPMFAVPMPASEFSGSMSRPRLREWSRAAISPASFMASFNPT